MMKHQFFHNYILKFKDLYFLFFSFLGILMLSFGKLKFEFYGLKWQLLSTPIGLLYAKFSSNQVFNDWLVYLLNQYPISNFSIFQISLACFVSIVGFVYLWRFKL